MVLAVAFGFVCAGAVLGGATNLAASSGLASVPDHVEKPMLLASLAVVLSVVAARQGAYWFGRRMQKLPRAAAARQALFAGLWWVVLVFIALVVDFT